MFALLVLTASLAALVLPIICAWISSLPRWYRGLRKVESLETSVWSFWCYRGEIEATGYQRGMGTPIPFTVALSHADLDAIQEICLSLMLPFLPTSCTSQQLLYSFRLEARRGVWEITRSLIGSLDESPFYSPAAMEGARTLAFCDGQTRVYSTWMIFPPRFILLIETEPLNSLEQILYFAEAQR